MLKPSQSAISWSNLPKRKRLHIVTQPFINLQVVPTGIEPVSKV